MANSTQSERSIHEMLKDTPSMNESNNSVHSGTTEAASSRATPKNPPTTLALKSISGN